MHVYLASQKVGLEQTYLVNTPCIDGKVGVETGSDEMTSCHLNLISRNLHLDLVTLVLFCSLTDAQRLLLKPVPVDI